ncbi:ATP-dependent helicase [Actinocorallia sp. API 0066]|uniref:ATP-dependent helicase n=1 Tax=Actinocorallia sp. API 0066 TaxID=2896846 RepID=UPI001E57CCE7|nr:ATP-dependent DNA helicase [Actinocorallia sp. API 0066]MCD0448094.1 ATP-dependent helicase [Actinocorallia sp. API 0066]
MITPEELARRLGLPEPTDEQAAVIRAPLGPLAVVAGAGSGKSETMAARVVWLVANRLVRPERVLGLTFTRKAAAELAARVRKRLDGLREHPDLVEPEILDGEPTVSTYHSYAARLFGDHALRDGLEPTLRLISPAVAWQIATRVVDAHDGPMDRIDWTPDTVTRAVIELSGDLAEHLRGPADVRAVGEWLGERFAALAKPLAKQREVLAKQETREQLLPLIEEYARAKARREVIDHGDQMSFAARIAARHPEVGAIERSRYPVVLLDEYQDTGHAQLVLLRSLFGGGHPVTAVGDPCQSIYGWRGASAGNLLGFPRDFPGPGGREAPMRELTRSFRNGERILGAAARVQAELRAEMRRVSPLRPGAGRIGRGRVECALLETVQDEAERIAERIAALLGTEDPETGERLRPSDIAILARKRVQFPLLRQRLVERDIKVEVVGLGGLLSVPEVQDVVATLRVMQDPTAGASLARLLTGPRWRIGPRDLVALGRRARDLAREARRDITREDVPEPEAPPPEADPLAQLVRELGEEQGSLVDALDDPGPTESYSSDGLRRLLRLRDELRYLRRQIHLPLPDLVAEIERVLGLDIEVAARSGLDPVTARADLDAFVDAAAAFAGDNENPTAGAFLAYLAAAESEEFGLEAGRVSEAESVKLLTVHASKGLEWPVVFVPGLAFTPQKSGAPGKGSVFPTPPANPTRWTANPRLIPFPLRGDRADLPALPGLAKEELAAFEEACAERDFREERRLAYVAVTRASELLVATGYRWGSSAKPLGASPFLTEIREEADTVWEWAPEPAEDAHNPLLAEPKTGSWPAPPLGEGPLVEGARLVRDAMVGRPAPWASTEGLEAGRRARLGAWARDVELLLAERDKGRGANGLTVELPDKLTVTSLVALAADPAELAARIRRPMPQPPAPFARRGTSFHRWLETRWGQQRLIDPDDLFGAADDDAEDAALDGDARLELLKTRFEESEWAEREPVDIEIPFETRIGDRLVRGRMDAVFRTEDGYEVVDWKTGSPPPPEARAHLSVQLAAYRLAWAALADVPLDRVSAAFHYVRANVTLRPTDLPDATALATLFTALPQTPT